MFVLRFRAWVKANIPVTALSRPSDQTPAIRVLTR